MTAILQVTTTLPTREAGLALARALVDQRLAACVQVAGPVTSVYRWNGAVEEAEEWYCHVKTAGNLWPALEAAIRAAHPYEVPEIVAFPVAQASDPYAAWVAAMTTATSPDHTPPSPR